MAIQWEPWNKGTLVAGVDIAPDERWLNISFKGKKVKLWFVRKFDGRIYHLYPQFQILTEQEVQEKLKKFKTNPWLKKHPEEKFRYRVVDFGQKGYKLLYIWWK